jgi:hypothetical protein
MSFENASKSLYKAMKGIGTDEKKIIEVICSHTKSQRQEIKKTYMKMYDKVRFSKKVLVLYSLI